MIGKKKDYFGLEESVCNPGYYMIKILDYEGFYLNGTLGSYNVIFARLMNLSYAQFLRFCRDVCGAELVGKGALYVVPMFNKKTQEVRELVKLLNNLANVVIWEREHPNWQEHQAEVLAKEMKVFGIVKENLDAIKQGNAGEEES